MNLNALPWFILFLPLGAAAAIALFTQRNQKVSAGLSIAAVLAAFALSGLFVHIAGWQPAPAELKVDWLSVASLHIDFGLHLDRLSLLMTLVVTGVAGLIHIYSVGYMRGDKGYSRFFACLSLFTFSMLGIVLATNFVQLFILWELVGVSSYLLIGFWYGRAAAADAAKKAFITNRLGDFGFLLGILTVWGVLGSVHFGTLQEQLKANPGAIGHLATAAGLLIFCGAVGKSAQFPLHVWLPDAMEGPTPVSALIHAATMVAAGVYMLCRVQFLLDPVAFEVISYIGGFTALLAAVIAVQQNDIKRILAYSTLSQLGYMTMAVGLNAPDAAMFHLTTHAFFKALLFLGAGSVILALHHEQDIWNMGALRKSLPVTYWTFAVGTLALAGLWPLSGFFSKDGILAAALARHVYPLFALGWIVAILTTFYMFRLVLVAFFGPNRSSAAGHATESPAVMLWPLRILAVFAVIGGIIGIEPLYNAHFGSEVAARTGSLTAQILAPFKDAPFASLLGLAAVGIGFLAALALYRHTLKDPLPERLGMLSRAMRNRFYFDEIYEATVIRLHDLLAAIADWVDRWIIAGLGVRGLHGTTEFAGRALRLLQTGNLQTYALLFALGVAALLFVMVFK